MKELEIKSDSLSVLSKIVVKKDEIILNQTQDIALKDSIIINYKNIVGEKEIQLSSYKDEVKKQKTQKFVAWGITATSIILSLVKIL